MKRMHMLAIILLIAALSVSAAPVSVSSPNGQIQIFADVKNLLEPYPVGDRLYYSVEYNGSPLLLDSPIRLDFEKTGSFATDLEIVQTETRTHESTWEPVWGTEKKIRDHFNELTCVIKEKKAPFRTIHFIFRAFNDGIAFHYEIPQQSVISEFNLQKENTWFVFAGNYKCWPGKLQSFRTHQEIEYTPVQLSEIIASDICASPLLIETAAAWVAITESNLVDWAGMYLSGVPNLSAVQTVLSPRMDDPTVAVKSTAPRTSPWRTLLIGEKPGDLIESNLVVNLADPCEMDDTDWITPGISAWDRWWPGSYAPDFDGDMGVNNESMKYFIDLAADMKWEYQLVDWEWYGPPFDPAKPFGSAGNPAADLTKSIDVIDIPELVTYAAQKNVKILVWLDWENANRQMDKAFPRYEKWGVAGVKVDFMARDDQEMVNFYHRLVKLAAKHHLTVDFHGAYKPTGFRRTYPNLMTREGVLGNEYNKWSDRITPAHNVTLPFTRMLCGPMDYTPGGWRNKTPNSFRIVGGDAPGPFVQTTRAAQLAMFVIYERPLQVACDSPYNYRMSPYGNDFLQVVPTTWDHTKVIDGYPGEFIVMARQSGKKWYIAGMTNENEKTFELDLNFIGQGKFTARIWADPEEAQDYPDRIDYTEKQITAQETLTLKMAGSGGIAIEIIPN